MSEFNTIDNVIGAFTTEDKTVITWEGGNYYKACDVIVVDNPGGGHSGCVKRFEHPGSIHEDYDGVRRTEDNGRVAVVVTFPVEDDMAAGYQSLQEVLTELKPIFSDTDRYKIYGVVKAAADQVIMILEGDG